MKGKINRPTSMKIARAIQFMYLYMSYCRYSLIACEVMCIFKVQLMPQLSWEEMNPYS